MRLLAGTSVTGTISICVPLTEDGSPVSPPVECGSGSDPLLGPRCEEKNRLQGCRHEYHGLSQLWDLLFAPTNFQQEVSFSGERSQGYGTLASYKPVKPDIHVFSGILHSDS